jgi:hypothetical protein
MTWVEKINNIRHKAEESVYSELIHQSLKGADRSDPPFIYLQNLLSRARFRVE